jgi:hypothetical protein
MIRVQSTVYPKQRATINTSKLTVGEMINYWNTNGHFNFMLYQQISVAKSR